MRKNNRKKKWICLLAFGVCLAGIFLILCCPKGEPVTKEQLDSLPLDGIEHLMIIAHPDDETFWGGAHLLKEKYFVVCLTNGTSNTRKQEFIKAVTLTGSIPFILNYPDRQFGIRSHWFGHEKRIQKDINVLLSYRDWKQIVTHNPDGEYGHIHHKKTSKFVTRALKEKTKLFYFGIYYSEDFLKNNINQTIEPILEEELQKKMQLVKCYTSQEKAVRLFSHMFPYENWIPEKEWKNGKQKEIN